MDIRISLDRKLSFVIYQKQMEISLTLEEFMELQLVAEHFLKEELENGGAFNNWVK